MSSSKHMLVLVLVLVHVFVFVVSLTCAFDVSYDSKALIINGQRRIIISGSIHYPRSTPEMWPDLIRKGKEGGLDAIETYVFWDRHEPEKGKYDFTGNYDLVAFLKHVQSAGLYVILRIGPYVCAEWSYGGFPAWLHNIPGIELRTDNEVYKKEMETFTTKIVNLMKEAKMFASQGGPIILAQIENEYGNIMDKYGEAGKSYIKWCAQMAVAQNIGVPWIMCQQSDAPQPMINTCNGYYCHDFKPNNPKSPKMWTENWIGWFTEWGKPVPHRAAEDCAYAIARFFQTDGVLMNYYMYHGGTNFGRTAGGPYIATSYDYDAPLDEYGNLNHPKYEHLRQLHKSLKVGEKAMTSGPGVTTKYVGADLTTYTNNATGETFCFLSNTNQTQDVTVDLMGAGKLTVPAWSVSILQNCTKEIYNTAKIGDRVSPSAMEKNIIFENPLGSLDWAWLPEPLKIKTQLKENRLLDQKTVTVGASDYLWYTTTFNIDEQISWTWTNATISVTTKGHALHAFVNKQIVGSQWATDGKYEFTFQKPVSGLKQGANSLELLSTTVGLANYGAFFDTVPVGLVNGTVQIIGAGNAKLDLTSNEWSYKVGLTGESKLYYDPNHNTKFKWKKGELVKGRALTWYMTQFEAPGGTDPVVVDLTGLGKGHAWINGHSIGRYWPSYMAKNDGCTPKCDYRGQYNSEKCQHGCGSPTQRYYHIPRSFLKPADNVIILFEEIGGDPSKISFLTAADGAGSGCTAAAGGSGANVCPSPAA
ncbi:hypothetical protein L6164_004562 [Bauhinia variegata]|uniref:Uncharacterized protein n=1 Tax=Bauhinia variegata TaxID=167791 RepID=A0ACB9Q4B5_BAUVA|nr:hypothetical protein L6164_004562 [Bauhinia variegata]